jgi:hypothetical protein
VHQDVGFLAGLRDEVGGCVEVETEVVVLVVLPGDVKTVGNVLLGMADVNVLAGSEYRPDFVF